MQIRIPNVSEEATAAVKGAESYSWYSYESQAAFQFLVRGKQVGIAHGTRFGIRTGTGNTVRLVLGNAVTMSKVMTITEAEQDVLIERSTPVSSRSASPKVKAANKAIQGDGDDDIVGIWNAEMAPALKALRAKVATLVAPELSVDTIQVVLDLAVEPLVKSSTITAKSLRKAVSLVNEAANTKVSKQRLPARMTDMQTTAIQIFNAAKKNKHFLPASFKIKEVGAHGIDEAIGYIMGIKDFASHVKLAHWMFMGNTKQALKASYMDTASRDEIPNKAWDWIQDNLR